MGGVWVSNPTQQERGHTYAQMIADKVQDQFNREKVGFSINGPEATGCP